jgi:hypothetical protein
MELFTAGDKSQMKTIEQWIDESDVYMLILGGRYGSIEPASGLSYTELEYDYANINGKPIFATVIEEEAIEAKVRLHGTAFMEKDNPAALKQFREKVLRNVSSFFHDSKDVKLCVYESMSDHGSNAALKGWISADEVQDVSPLQEEIRKLREQRDELLKAASRSEAASAEKAKKDSGITHDDLVAILRATDIKIPAKIIDKGSDQNTNLLIILMDQQNSLVNGVTNSARSGKVEIFLYYNVCPKLQIHGLVDSEKVAGAQFRRCFLNKLGREFLASIDKKLVVTSNLNTSSGMQLDVEGS